MNMIMEGTAAKLNMNLKMNGYIGIDELNNGYIRMDKWNNGYIGMNNGYIGMDEWNGRME